MDPFDFLKRIEKSLDKQFERFDRSFLKNYRRPSCDISQDKNNIKINVELPGIEKKDIFLQIRKHDVEIRAERRKSKIKKEKGSYKEEKFYRGYHRIIPIPTDVLPEKAKAKLSKGRIFIVIPKVKKIIRKIKIR